MLRAVFQVAALVLCAAMPSVAQAGTGDQINSPAASDGQTPPALIRSVRITPASEAPAVEIIATRPLTPALQVLKNPPRLVIDLSNSVVAAPQRIAAPNRQIRGVRVNQFSKNPPSVRVVVDLMAPAGYSWDEAGNRLLVRLHSHGQGMVSASTVSKGPPVREPKSTRGTGSLIRASSRSVESSIGGDTETVTVPVSGGEVHVCSGTAMSVTPSQSGRDVMLAFSTGALETYYDPQFSGNFVLTPDFRIAASGTGRFEFAISADLRGNTCVRALPGNTASAIVTELMGEGSYQLGPGERVVFHDGQVAARDATVPGDCGCSSPGIPVMRAAATEGSGNGSPNRPSSVGEIALVPGPPDSSGLPTLKANDVHVQIDAPLVFRASEEAPKPAPEPAANNLAAGAEQPNLLKVIVVPPRGEPREAGMPPSHRGFLGRVKSFFAGIFH